MKNKSSDFNVTNFVNKYATSKSELYKVKKLLFCENSKWQEFTVWFWDLYKDTRH